MKGMVTVILPVFVAASVVYMVVGQRGEGNAAPTAATVTLTLASEPAQNIAENDAEIQKVAEHDDGDAAAANAPVETIAKSQEPTKVPRTVVAYYFHQKQRCHTCLTMESYAEGALQEGLPDAVELGELEWRPVNVEEPQHEHFVREYDLYASALVMVGVEGNEVKRSKNLKQIWDLVGDESKFKAYVRDEALAYLKNAP